MARMDGAEARAELAACLSSVQGAVASSRAAPLSARLALYAAVLLDRMSDAGFARRDTLTDRRLATAGDILAFRAGLRQISPALGLIMDLTTCHPDAPRLQIVARPVPPDDFANLPVGDLMVSLYNSGTVPRLMLVQQDGTEHPMAEVSQAGAGWWAATLAALAD